jgi:hypothetical protein
MRWHAYLCGSLRKRMSGSPQASQALASGSEAACHVRYRTRGAKRRLVGKTHARSRGQGLVAVPAPDHNHILNALPADERKRLVPHLRLVQLPLGKVLYESGGLQRHVYFPVDSIDSLLYVLQNGASAEITRSWAMRVPLASPYSWAVRPR